LGSLIIEFSISYGLDSSKTDLELTSKLEESPDTWYTN